jgi:hypothetical protein
MCLNGTYGTIRTGGLYMYDQFPIQNSLKQGDSSSPQLFNFISEYDIRMVQENQMGCN